MSIETITKALRYQYDVKDQQIVVWYDEGGRFKDSFDTLELEGVEKLEVHKNIFWIKHRVYYEAPKHKYLLYIPTEKPSPKQNWLLDIALSYYEFDPSEESMIVDEFDLDIRLTSFVREHIKFFRSAKNKTAFSSMAEKSDDEESLINKMMAVCTGAKDDTLEELMYILFGELADERESKSKNLDKYGLKEAFYQRVASSLDYENSDPSMMGLVIYLLNNRFRLCLKETEYVGNKEASLFVNHWMQHGKLNKSFTKLSNTISRELNIEQSLQGKSMEELAECDTYKCIELVMVEELTTRLVSRSITNTQISEMITLRKSKFWYDAYDIYYKALHWASEFYFLQENITLKLTSFEQGLETYTKQWYKFDYAYRKYFLEISRCEMSSKFDTITTNIEKFYANNYLVGLSDAWYERLNDKEQWRFPAQLDQKSFYTHHVAPQLAESKTCVIISDALRYESGKELNDRLNTISNMRTEFSYMVASLPSYTQLGMASLLPHDELSYREGKFDVFVDGQSSKGTENRTKILQKRVPESMAISAENFLKMKKDEMRTFFKPYKLIYIYENSIDSRGKPPTEDQVFGATEECFERVERLTKKVQNDLQWRNILITADHGYLYEKTNIDESNFCKVPKDEKFSDSNKRMAIGNDLSDAPCVLKYDAQQLNISGDTQFLIAKSMQRIRSKGGGSKFVHGGATLQEVVVPLIKVSRHTELKSSTVDFDIIQSSSLITSNVFPVTFLQKEPVEEKRTAQQIQVSICDSDGKVLSDVHEVILDSTEKDTAKMHKKVTFSFSRDLSGMNGQSVHLKVMTKAQGTNDYNKENLAKQMNYTINISFGGEEW